jgi:FkbM family methyltransferase
VKIERTYVLRSGLAKGLKKRGGLGLRQWLPSTERLSAEDIFLQALDFTGQTIFDIGGAQGIHTIFFADRAGPQGRVVTFEPDRENYEYILRNVAINGLGNVAVQNVGVSERPGELEFAYPSDHGQGSAHPDHLERHRELPRITLPVTSIDAQRRSGEIPAPDFVKIDVEGLELPVLKGMVETAAQCKPAIFVELHGWGVSAKQANSRRVVEWLDAQGYEAHHVESGLRITFANAAEACEGHLYCVATTAGG